MLSFGPTGNLISPSEPTSDVPAPENAAIAAIKSAREFAINNLGDITRGLERLNAQVMMQQERLRHQQRALATLNAAMEILEKGGTNGQGAQPEGRSLALPASAKDREAQRKARPGRKATRKR